MESPGPISAKVRTLVTPVSSGLEAIAYLHLSLYVEAPRSTSKSSAFQTYPLGPHCVAATLAPCNEGHLVLPIWKPFFFVSLFVHYFLSTRGPK